jgi:hypothetical protein
MEAKEQTMVLVSASGARVGSCVHTPRRGWRFISAVSSHGDSRKFWEDCNACIPKWAFDLADEMLTADEWAKRREIAA